MKLFNKILFVVLLLVSTSMLASSPLTPSPTNTINLTYTLVISHRIAETTVAMVTIPGFINVNQCVGQAQLISKQSNNVDVYYAFCVAVMSNDKK